MSYEDIRFEIDEGVAVITLHRPERMNAFGGQMRQQLARTLEALKANAAIRVVVITGGGGRLGSAYAELLVREGAKLVVNDLDAGKRIGKRPPAALAAGVSGNGDLVRVLRPGGGLGPLLLGLVEDPELIRVDLLALRAKALVAEQPHVLAQLRDLGVTGFELRVTGLQFRATSFELGISLENQSAESCDRVRELLCDVHHERGW